MAFCSLYYRMRGYVLILLRGALININMVCFIRYSNPGELPLHEKLAGIKIT